jgi:hypothetical protein
MKLTMMLLMMLDRREEIERRGDDEVESWRW